MTNSFTKAQITEAKTGVHYIAWQPGKPAQEYKVTKVRGGLVYVQALNGPGSISKTEYSLNSTASAKLIAGGYR